MSEEQMWSEEANAVINMKVEASKVDSEKSDELRDFGTGATRSKDADSERYDLISPFAMRRLAKIMAEGAKTH